MSFEFTAPPKDPSAALDYQMDWSDWLFEGETIQSAEVREESDVLTISDMEVLGGRVQWRVAGGEHRGNYVVTVRVTTSTDQVDERSIRFPVRNR